MTEEKQKKLDIEMQEYKEHKMKQRMRLLEIIWIVLRYIQV